MQNKVPSRRTVLKWIALGAVALRVGGKTMAAEKERAAWLRELDAWVEEERRKLRVPGLAIGLVDADGGEVLRGYGWRDANKREGRVDAATIFHVASVSKLVTAASLMLLEERGRLRLDDPIAGICDFPVAHPRFSEIPVTFRQLLTHTSGISDQAYNDGDFTKEGDPSIGLREFLVGYLVSAGPWYDPTRCFGPSAPGAAWSYSNVALALAGYLSEKAVGVPLDVFSRREIFAPLGMDNTAWFLRDVAHPERLAVPHMLAEKGWQTFPQIGYPDWPAGSLRTTTADFARFLRIFLRGREGDNGPRIFQPATIDAMLTRQPIEGRHQAIAWYGANKNGDLGHSGGDPGSVTAVRLLAGRQRAVSIFVNLTETPEVVAFTHEVLDRLATAPLT